MSHLHPEPTLASTAGPATDPGTGGTGGDSGGAAPTPAWFDRSGRVALWVVTTAWVVILALILTRRVFISHDSLSNNVHVWWIADQLWDGHGIPFHMPVLASGEAYTFPYASVPWITAAFLWPLFGDWTVTLWLVIGFVGTVVATFWAFPTLRRGWWAAATLTNPALVIAPLLGQLPFLWSIACFTAAIGCWRRGRVVWAVVLTALAQIIHPAVVMPIVAVVVVLWAPFEQRARRWPMLGWWALTVVVSLPAAWMVFSSPVVAQTSTEAQVLALLQTVGMRFLVLGIPIGLVLVQRLRPPLWTPVALTVVFVVLQVPMYRPFGMNFAWGAMWRDPVPSVDAFADSDGMVPGRTYRVLSGFDGKYGLYAVVRAGGVLDAEFFPEGLHRGGFSTLEGYARFLRSRDIERVVVFPTYGERYQRSNEPERLEEMVAAGCVEGVRVTRLPEDGIWSLYRVQDC